MKGYGPTPTIHFPNLFIHLRALDLYSHFFLDPIGILLLWVRVFRTGLTKCVGIRHIPFTQNKLSSCYITLSSSKLKSYLTLNVGKRGELERISTLPMPFLAYREYGWLYQLYTLWWVTPSCSGFVLYMPKCILFQVLHPLNHTHSWSIAWI